jgi:hypothetical protein
VDAEAHTGLAEVTAIAESATSELGGGPVWGRAGPAAMPNGGAHAHQAGATEGEGAARSERIQRRKDQIQWSPAHGWVDLATGDDHQNEFVETIMNIGM